MAEILNRRKSIFLSHCCWTSQITAARGAWLRRPPPRSRDSHAAGTPRGPAHGRAKDAVGQIFTRSNAIGGHATCSRGAWCAEAGSSCAGRKDDD
jgi:hypothetical protein